jgi:hypothetical protein
MIRPRAARNNVAEKVVEELLETGSADAACRQRTAYDCFRFFAPRTIPDGTVAQCALPFDESVDDGISDLPHRIGVEIQTMHGIVHEQSVNIMTSKRKRPR